MSARPQTAAAAPSVLGRYRLGPVIGRGATAAVHRALDTDTGELVAVKIVPAHAEVVPRVRAEIRAVVRLEHPGVVALLDWGEDEDAVYLISELVEGASLAAELAGGPVDARDAVSVTRDVLGALAHAHSRGVVHRDVKPANILVESDGRGRLTDFGIARLAGESRLTATGGVVGTMAYMAPEQARGSQAGPRADVYAATLVLYEALTGVSPLLAESPAEMARRAAEGDIPPLRELRPDLPRQLLDAVDAGLERAARARPDAIGMEFLLARADAGLGLSRHARRAAPLASGIVGAAVTGAALATATELGTAAVVAASVGVGLAAAAWPRATVAAGAIAGTALIASANPGAAVVLGALAVAIVMTGWRLGRLVLLPALGPLLLALGLGPLYAAFAGAASTWPRRLWAGIAGVAAMLAWQVSAGSDALLFGGRRVDGGVAGLAGELSPLAAADALTDPVIVQAGALAQGAVLIVATLAFPLVVRAQPGLARAGAAGAWALAIAGLAMAYANDAALAVAATLPSVVILIVWGFQPLMHRRGRATRSRSATLRSPTR